MTDTEVEIVMLEGKCPKCSIDDIQSVEGENESIHFECLDCGWCNDATEKQFVKCVQEANQYPRQMSS